MRLTANEVLLRLAIPRARSTAAGSVAGGGHGFQTDMPVLTREESGECLLLHTARGIERCELDAVDDAKGMGRAQQQAH